MKTNNKEALRLVFKDIRRRIPQQRRVEAEKKLLEEFYPTLVEYKHIVSVASFGDEINLWPLNTILCREKRLLLPRVENNHLVIYDIQDLQHLIPSSLGILEPDPKKTSPFDKAKIDCALIPGLAFDQEHHRLGYGKGHFDKLLAELKHCKTLGVGFREQFREDVLPVESHDRKLDFLIIV